jgi:putative ABC transport system permease protein
LPSGTSAPNTVITEYAMKKYHISSGTSDWLVVGTQGFTAAQISGAQLTASTSQLQVESRNDIPSGSTIINDATLFGILIALGVLAMSVGLVRSETASDMRTLAATGASSYTRRTLTAVTAGALGFLGALLGVAGGYVAMLGFLRSNSLNGGISALTDVPVRDLMLLLVGMPLIAAAVGWLFASREPAIMGRQPIE